MTHGNAKMRVEPPSAVPGTRKSELGRRASQKLFPLIYPYSVCSFVKWISVKQVLSVLKLQLTATFRGQEVTSEASSRIGAGPASRDGGERTWEPSE